MALALAACGGDDGAQGPTGPQGPQGPTGPSGPPGPNAVILTPNTPAATFAALDIRATVQSVTIASPPVVRFTLKDAEGKPIVGFGASNKCFPRGQTTNAYVPKCYANLAFSLAKLVPGTTVLQPPINVKTPSKWVSYIVTTVPRESAPTTIGLDRPTTDNTGTLVDNGDGSYTYTFYRDIPGIKALVDGITAPSGSDKADLGDLTYVPTLTHRLTIQIAGNAPGTGTNNPTGLEQTGRPGVPLVKAVDVVYDFVPATGQAVTASDEQRKVTTTSNCDSCHSTLGGLPGDNPESSGAGFHGGSRNNVEYCVVCHTDQRKYGRAEATISGLAFTGSTYRIDGRAAGDLPNMVHKIHGAGVMTKTGYNYADVLFEKGGYSQDIRNCQKCHDGSNPATPQGNNWKNVPSRLACGACHDGINFATGAGVTLKAKAAGNLTVDPAAHPAGALADDTLCATCHGPVGGSGPTRIDTYHIPVTPPNTGSSLHVGGGNANTNSAWIASNSSRLPTGAIKVAYEVKEVRLNGTRNPQIVFRFLLDGVVTQLQDFATAPNNAASGRKEIFPNFMGSPSCYFVWSVPQDGVAAPQDFNVSAQGYIRSLWAGTATGTGAGNIVAGTGADANFYVCTLTGVTVAADAKMFSGGIGYSYNASNTLPLTQTNLQGYPVPQPGFEARYVAPGAAPASPAPNPTGGLIVIAPNVQKVGNGFTGRRAIVEDAKCNACHQELGTFTEDAFHAGQRNDGTTCAWCHRPNQTSSAWTADAANMTHAIHGGAKRNVPYTWHAVSTTDTFASIKYPGVLARCEQCHVAGSYDFSNAASADAAGIGADQIEKRLPKTVGVGFYVRTAGNQLTTYSGATCTTTALGTAQSATGAFSISPYVTANGLGDGTNPNTGTYYGAGFIHNAGAATANSCSANGTLLSVAAGGTRQADPQSLVLSPTVAACVACHDSNLAVSHMQLNGGAFYEPRSSALGKVEQCFVCHASDRIASIRAVHAR